MNHLMPIMRNKNLWLLSLLLIPILYSATLARSTVLGDPSEFTFVANILGIAHPPGYAFITLLGYLFQRLIPFGEIAWRMHLLSTVIATTAAFLVFGTIQAISRPLNQIAGLPIGLLAALFGAFSVAFGANYWQHAIHANPHIITAAFLAANLFLLTSWWASIRDFDETNPGRANPGNRWLYAFSLSAGLGITHHPLTVFSFAAYTIFILVVRPAILRDWRTILKMLGFALIGLSLWLYFPIRSGMSPPFGPSTMNTLDGFLDHVLGRGITEALPFYSLIEQPSRFLVFWSILRLQYALPVIFLACFAIFWPLMDRILSTRGYQKPAMDPPSAPLLLYLLTFLSNYFFVISLKAQDIMAYLLGPLLIIGLLAGIGLYALILYLNSAFQPGKPLLIMLITALFLLGPAGQSIRNVSRVSLRQYDEGQEYVDAVFSWFEDQGNGAVLLNDWEHMTPLWYTQFVEERWPDPDDVRPEYVSTARTWLENVFDFLPGGPVYLSNYRREIVDAGFRLRPAGPFYQVVEPGDKSVPPYLTPVNGKADAIEIVGYQLPDSAIAGDFVPFTLAMRAPERTEDYYIPVITIGEIKFPFTTDSHLTTPNWQPGEIIVERFDFALPHDFPAGNYPVSVSLKNLSEDQDTSLNLPLTRVEIAANSFPSPATKLLANFRQRVGLEWATARDGIRQVSAPWMDPLVVQPGDVISLVLGWSSLDYAEESYTVFVHLIDQTNRPLIALDYTPLGGAMPTHLWIPKWLPGQAAMDPYRLEIPVNLEPGNYLIEVGLYEMVGQRRLHIADSNGNLTGDRYILGSVIVEERDS